MAEFKRSRLVRSQDDEISKRAIAMGFVTVLIFVFIIFFGLPLLVRFSVFLGEAKSKRNSQDKEKIVPPLPPRLVTSFEATNSSKIGIRGFAEAGCTVELLKNDVSVGKKEVEQNGEFVFEEVELERGENGFGAVAFSLGGGSEISKILKVVYDDVSPELVLSSPAGDNISVDVTDYEMSGRTEKGVSVRINDRVAMVNDNGDFRLKIQLNTGKNDVEVVARDVAGNETRKKVVITYDI